MATQITVAAASSHTGAVSARTYSGLSNRVTAGAGRPTPLVVALHGGTYTSKYFDVPGASLLDAAAERGIPAIALDRPGYRDTPALTEAGEAVILANGDALSTCIEAVWDEYGAGTAGIVLLGHSIGAAVATVVASQSQRWPLLGLAISGCLVRVPPASREAWLALPEVETIDLPAEVKDEVMFGPAGTYDPQMSETSRAADAPVPRTELLDITGPWIDRRQEMCARVRVPVHHRQGEHDALWITSEEEVAEFRAGFTASPQVDSELLPGSGHCIDFHTPGPQFQRAQLEFALTCAAASSQ